MMGGNNNMITGKVILVTGAAGFIGSNLVLRLLSEDAASIVVGLDNVNDYYDVKLKEYRLFAQNKIASECLYSKYFFEKINIADKDSLESVFDKYKPDIVVNLAAQAGVRYSITNPDAYIESNVLGFYNILEACRRSYDDGRGGVEHLVYASSSSVYGSNKKIPY